MTQRRLRFHDDCVAFAFGGAVINASAAARAVFGGDLESIFQAFEFRAFRIG